MAVRGANVWIVGRDTDVVHQCAKGCGLGMFAGAFPFNELRLTGVDRGGLG